MTSHRYAFAHRLPKKSCPNCGHKRLRTYIDLTTGEECDHKYGMCDRKEGCGYFLAPSGLAKDYEPKKKMQPPPIRRTSWRCPQKYVDATIQHNEHNTLLKWLRSIVGDKADRVWSDYRVGTYPPGRRTELMYATCYWQISGDDMPRSAKIIPYHPNGKRVKELGSTWMHSVITATPDNPRGDSMETLGIGQCLFGEHLLRQQPDALVAVVESEKSALIGSCFYPDVIWVATGGSNTFTVERCMALAGRKVVVFPDAGMYEEWLAHSIDISLMCESMVVSDILEAMGVTKGDDIADYLIHEQDGQYIQVVDLDGVLTPPVTTPAIIPQPLQDTPPADPKRQRIDTWTNNVAQPWNNQQFMQTIAKSPMAEIFERPAIKELDAIFELDKANATLKPYDGTQGN